MIKDSFFYGSRIYRYRVTAGRDLVYTCVSLSDDQDSIMKQIEAICLAKKTLCIVTCNGEIVAKFGEIYNRNGKIKSNQRKIKCRETGEVFKNMRQMIEETGYDRKYCDYLVNRTTRYSYID